MLYEGLRDVTFFVAPGEWTLWRCSECASAYLDPRPDERTVGLAYANYYTHSSGHPPEPATVLQRVRSALANGYRNERYKTQLPQAWRAGYLLAMAIPPLAAIVDIQFRYLPRARSAAPRVLDVGCGSGEWLGLAHSAGYRVAGIEPDPVARQRACSTGLDVRGSFADFAGDRGGFDYITLSHVLEHVHDSVATLRECHGLLRPGGAVFVDTPNIDALGHRLYGRYWRGLEVPRHLVLFNLTGLSQILSEAGFVRLRHRVRSNFPALSYKSRLIMAGADPENLAPQRLDSPQPKLITRIHAQLTRRRSEFLTLTAVKP
jgi:2-polyprenyl-3-methyl-5-hydroxy-6-metoxy-1,4-benzoquinol methylase